VIVFNELQEVVLVLAHTTIIIIILLLATAYASDDYELDYCTQAGK
jgi:hypothetical protein